MSQATLRHYDKTGYRRIGAGFDFSIFKYQPCKVFDPYADWIDAELLELLDERIAIMQHHGQVDPIQAEKLALYWFRSEIGEKRFLRIASNGRSASQATKDTPEKPDSQISNVAVLPTNDTTKWLPDAVTPDSLSTQLNWS